MMVTIEVAVDGFRLSLKVDSTPPLGWRFWRLAGFAADPIDPQPYGGTRCLALAMVDTEGQARWLCAMERDGSFQLLCTHDLFPSADQIGADDFARELLGRTAKQPKLL